MHVVQAATAVDLLALSRADFQRLLGPLQDLMAANAAKYAPLVPSSKAVRCFAKLAVPRPCNVHVCYPRICQGLCSKNS